MRLIDEEALMNNMQKTITEQSSTIDWMNLIYRQPVAYDLENVVMQLEEYMPEMEKIGCGSILADIIDVVKCGGVKETNH